MLLSQQICWDRSANASAVPPGLTEQSAPFCAYNHTLHFANGDASSGLPTLDSARPQKPIRLRFPRRPSTAGGSLERSPQGTYAFSTVLLQPL